MAEFPNFSAYGYEIVKPLGINRYGARVTYQAVQITSQEAVVIKQFKLVSSESNWSDYKAVERELDFLKQTIKNLSLSDAKQSHFGICNYDQGTILIEIADFNKNSLFKSKKCLNNSHNSYPDSVPDVAGNYNDVVIENYE